MIYIIIPPDWNLECRPSFPKFCGLNLECQPNVVWTYIHTHIHSIRITVLKYRFSIPVPDWSSRDGHSTRGANSWRKYEVSNCWIHRTSGQMKVDVSFMLYDNFPWESLLPRGKYLPSRNSWRGLCWGNDHSVSHVKIEQTIPFHSRFEPFWNFCMKHLVLMRCEVGPLLCRWCLKLNGFWLCILRRTPATYGGS